jgi:hypothetical protein
MAEEISPLENHGWWMEQLRKDAKAQQPEALRLADALELKSPRGVLTDSKAAAELRRLHAENTKLTQLLADTHDVSADLAETSDALHRTRQQRDELLAALKEMLPGAEAMGWNTDKARAAIAKAEGV